MSRFLPKIVAGIFLTGGFMGSHYYRDTQFSDLTQNYRYVWFKTRNVSRKAVQSDYSNLSHVPKWQLTDSFYVNALYDHSYGWGDEFRFCVNSRIPMEFIDPMINAANNDVLLKDHKVVDKLKKLNDQKKPHN